MTKIVHDHSHSFQNPLNTTQTDSAPEATDTANPAVNNEPSEARNPVAKETEPLEPEPSGVDSATAVANDTGDTVGPKDEIPVIEPITGAKRDLDTSEAPASTLPAENKEKAPEPSEERDPKKQKTDEKPAATSNGNAASADSKKGGTGQKKDGRPTKEKIKDTVKKIIPGEGIGSRTRSRTKGT
jgi:hypothetical protein